MPAPAAVTSPWERFTLIAVLDEGPGRVLCRALDTVSGRPLLLELIDPDARAVRAEAAPIEDVPRGADAILARARRAADVVHPHLARIGEIGLWRGRVFVAFDEGEGEDLAALVGRRGSCSPPVWRAIGLGVTAALARAHSAGLVHGAIDPKAVRVLPRGAVLFGVGLERAPSLRAFTAPERWAGAPADARADVYAFGAVSAYAATGRGPRAAANAHASAHASAPASDEAGAGETPSPAAPAAAPPPDELDLLIARCLADDPALRPADGVLLHELFDSASRAAAVASGGSRSARRSLRHGAIAFFFALIASLALLLLLPADETPAPAIEPPLDRSLDAFELDPSEGGPTAAERAAWRTDGVFLLERAARAESPAARRRLARRAAPLLQGDERARALAIAEEAEGRLASFTEREAAALLDQALAAAEERRAGGRLEAALAAFADAAAVVERHPALAARSTEIAAARQPVEAALVGAAGDRGDFEQAAAAAREAARLADFLGRNEESAALGRRAELFDRLSFCELVLEEQARFVTLELERLAPQTRDVDGARLLAARAAIVLGRDERARELLRALIDAPDPGPLAGAARELLDLL